MSKQIQVGLESFERIREDDYFYVDKTLFIKDLLEKRGVVTLITRPRRFGKTMNMSMLRSFFDINRDSRSLFEGLDIAEHQDICEKQMNKYPVIFFSMKNVEQDTYEMSIEKIKTLVSAIFSQCRYIYESGKLDERQNYIFHTLLNENSSEVALQNSLLFLTECLYEYYKKRVIVLLDEYDSPIDSAERKGYYPKMID